MKRAALCVIAGLAISGCPRVMTEVGDIAIQNITVTARSVIVRK